MRHLQFFSLFISLSLLAACQGDFWGQDKKEKLKGQRVTIALTAENMGDDIKSKTALPAENQLAVKNNSWPVSVANSNFTAANLQLGESKKAKALLSVKGNSKFSFLTTPLVDENFIYVMDASATVKAYNKAKSKVVWQNNELLKVSAFKGSGFFNGGMQLVDRVIYATAGLNSVIAIDAETGKSKWSRILRSATRAVPAVSKNIILVQTLDNSIYALAKETGEILWTHVGMNVETQSLTLTLPALQNEEVIVQYSADEVYKLSLDDGSEIWRTNVNSNSIYLREDQTISAAALMPIIQDGVVYAVSSLGQLFCLDFATGEAIWHKDLALDSSIWVADKYIYAVDREQQLLAIEKQHGQVRWYADIKQAVPQDKKGKKKLFFASSPLVAGDKIIVNTSLGQQLFFNLQDGKFISAAKIEKDITLPPIIYNGGVYLLSNRGRLISS